jgi:hypothetical protein
MQVAVQKSGRKTATMDLNADGLVSVYGKTAQQRDSEVEIPELYELPMNAIMQLRDIRRHSLDAPLNNYLQGLINEIWKIAAEEEPWFAFCCQACEED